MWSRPSVRLVWRGSAGSAGSCTSRLLVPVAPPSHDGASADRVRRGRGVAAGEGAAHWSSALVEVAADRAAAAIEIRTPHATDLGVGLVCDADPLVGVDVVGVH